MRKGLGVEEEKGNQVATPNNTTFVNPNTSLMGNSRSSKVRTRYDETKLRRTKEDRAQQHSTESNRLHRT